MPTKEEMQDQLEAILKSVPTDEEIKNILGFDLSTVQGLPPALTDSERNQLLEQIRSETATKETLRRTLSTLSGLVKLALVLRP